MAAIGAKPTMRVDGRAPSNGERGSRLPLLARLGTAHHHIDATAAALTH
jgi:hypothetical protein